MPPECRLCVSRPAGAAPRPASTFASRSALQVDEVCDDTASLEDGDKAQSPLPLWERAIENPLRHSHYIIPERLPLSFLIPNVRPLEQRGH